MRHGADGRSDCVSCHVVGYGREGGYQVSRADAALEDVGCETCHGRGGPHLSPAHAPQNAYEAVCKACHNPEHSLGFDYATFLPRVSHAATEVSIPAEICFNASAMNAARSLVSEVIWVCLASSRTARTMALDNLVRSLPAESGFISLLNEWLPCRYQVRDYTNETPKVCPNPRTLRYNFARLSEK